MAPRLERDGGFHFPNSEQENSLFLRTIISVMFGDTAVLALVPETAMAPAPAPAVACARCDADGCTAGCELLASAAAATGSSSNSEEHGGECSGSATRVVTGPEAAWASGEEGEQLQVTGACGGGRGASGRHRSATRTASCTSGSAPSTQPRTRLQHRCRRVPRPPCQSQLPNRSRRAGVFLGADDHDVPAQPPAAAATAGVPPREVWVQRGVAGARGTA
nr:unnamed protein product [Digitaria exilis]